MVTAVMMSMRSETAVMLVRNIGDDIDAQR